MRIADKRRILQIVKILAIVLFTSFIRPAFAQDTNQTVDRILSNTAVKAAQQFVDSDHERIVREIIAINEVPAPPFKESARARAFAQMLKDSGMPAVETDPEGNVLGLRKGTGSGPLIVIAAHLDTVFPEGTDVTFDEREIVFSHQASETIPEALPCFSQSSARWRARTSRRMETFCLSRTLEKKVREIYVGCAISSKKGNTRIASECLFPWMVRETEATSLTERSAAVDTAWRFEVLAATVMARSVW
jgi:hypothetical protein